MRALGANATVADVLRAETHDLTAPRCRFERELHYEPLLRSARPIGTISRNLVVGPIVMSLALGKLNLDACGRINLHHGGHGEAQ
jgi:hypothetical protein